MQDEYLNVNSNGAYKSSIQRLREDPNIRIVTDVPGLSWHIEYKVSPVKKEGKFRALVRRILIH
ncbi:hypothetical protein M1310_01370 [Candidatus Marsarchaeota archaeon]|jgi:hypothetical protein|nr:hypothetical protein [Candidatus Marsarchaeota archaeon]